MITLCIFNKKGDGEPIITYVGNVTFKKYKNRLYVYGASKGCDDIGCEELEQWNDNLWYAYVEV